LKKSSRAPPVNVKVPFIYEMPNEKLSDRLPARQRGWAIRWSDGLCMKGRLSWRTCASARCHIEGRVATRFETVAVKENGRDIMHRLQREQPKKRVAAKTKENALECETHRRQERESQSEVVAKIKSHAQRKAQRRTPARKRGCPSAGATGWASGSGVIENLAL
jgi:hypothetical protein